jgi:diguanylate cyclase (GGDEF)-like protein/PAS domain S-box-containing protein
VKLDELNDETVNPPLAPQAYPWVPVSAPPARCGVLVVEDDPLMQESVVALVRAPDREVVGCGTFSAALEHIRQRRFGIALLDINLPDRTGLELLENIRRIDPDLPVVMVTGEDSVDSAITALRLGACEFLRKPYSPARLREVVERTLTLNQLQHERDVLGLRLSHSERLHRYLVDHSPDLIYMLDEHGCFRFVNERFESLLGYAREDLLGRHFLEVVRQEDADRNRWAMNERRTGTRATKNLEMRFHCVLPKPQNDEWLPVTLSATGLYAESRKGDPSSRRFIGTYGVARDISERKKAQAALAHLALHDGLTGLPNRTLFRNRVSLAIAQAKREKSRVAVLFIDVDRFKLVNDTYGHVSGDQVLQQVARRLRHCLREVDTVSRLGGDAFTAVIPGVRKPEDADAIARKIHQVVGEPIMLVDAELTMSCSVGVALYPDQGLSEDELLRHSDLAMYRVKRSGKNGVAFYEPSMGEDSGRYLGLENDLRRAMQRDELSVHFQPIVDCDTGRVEGMEALARWTHPTLGLLEPSRFITIAENGGMMSELTSIIMDKAFSWITAWRAGGFPDLRIAVNVSAREFERRRFIDDVLESLQSRGLPCSALELEITESVLIEDVDAAVERVGALRALGVRVSIDDFGTRYSSLGYLRRLPVNTIKIDQSFVRGLRERGGSRPIVSAIVALAAGCGFEIVAEGVEDESDVAALRALGCRKMQGYYFGRPAAPEQVARALFRERSGT